MLSILYLIICVLTGYVLCSFCFPFLKGITDKTYGGEELSLSRFYVLIPAWYLSGTILVTWLVYITANIFSGCESPLAIANAIIMPLFAILSAVGIFFLHKRGELADKKLLKKEIKKIKISEIVFLVLAFLMVTILMWRTFYVHAASDTLRVGYSVFSDFAPHVGMIRSFSYGNNFPTQYSHFAGEDIRYHFMYQFYVGNLEFLGMRLDFAFNIPSMLGMLFVYWLLFVLAAKIFGKRAVAYLACLFFTFRCSPSLFSWLADRTKGTNVFQELKDNIEFIGYTTNENWGLWNLNVYCNQRHLALCVAVMILILICFLPNLYHMAERLKAKKEEKARFKDYFITCFFTKEGWRVRSLWLPVGLGIFLGATAFWNGAALLATIMVLFMFAVISDYRLEYLITALIAAGMSMFQSHVFVWGEVVSPKLQFGFIAENTAFFGTLDYIARLTGIFWWMMLVAFVVTKGVKKYILAAFSAPFVFSFCVSLTSDVTVNHKYIMMSLMLLGVFAAFLIVWMWEKKDVFVRILCIFLVIVMTATGFYDFTVVYKRNRHYISLDMNDPLTNWINDNTDSKDIFLTSWYSINNVVFGGAMLYYGWPYYAWSAGYDTDSRDKKVKEMYGAKSSEELDALIKENNISYIIVDNDNRTSKEYKLREDVIDATYEKCYWAGEGDWLTVVYDTSKPIY